MKNDKNQLWERFQKYYFEFPSLRLRTDLSRMWFEEGYFERMSPKVATALAHMEALEAGGIANPDENRMVGHYWLRNPSLSPTTAIRTEIEDTLARIRTFTRAVHAGEIQGQTGCFRNLLLIGIGGSSLGPQFVAQALSNPRTDRMKIFFFDNTDSDGMERVLATIGDELGMTLCVVVSKSGGTKETRNGMIEADAAYQNRGLIFEKHAIAITRNGSNLNALAKKNNWLATFPMWDWVGGRTSELCAVGLLPASLQGFDLEELIKGAGACDEITRTKQIEGNPAMQLALMWFHSGCGVGRKNMVVLPYGDRLELFSRYLQQLVMESVGKANDLEGHSICHGLTVFGNKGSTDQHSYVQQLIDGRDDAFVVFVEVLCGHIPERFVDVEPGLVSNDYLAGFLLGTRQALTAVDRESLTITIESVSAFTVGVLIALFERAVGYYSDLINVNAYHQPGVEAGKSAAEIILCLQKNTIHELAISNNIGLTVNDIVNRLGGTCDAENVFKICERLRSIGRLTSWSDEDINPFSRTYRLATTLSSK